MKHITEFNDFIFEKLILEIGDGGSKPYKYKLTRSDSGPYFKDYYMIYEFVTDLGTRYEVMFEIDEDFSKDGEWQIMKIEFGVVDVKGLDYSVETNKGELFRVMATIVDITKKILKKRKNIKTLTFTGAKTKKGSKDDQRRNNLYMAYIRRHIPNVKNIQDDGTEISVDIRE
tara:strand:+ start:1061 stop:1576 length:516 start_codon:yes stop_codon:yes gene_type:complete